jgi:hypothetical protein
MSNAKVLYGEIWYEETKLCVSQKSDQINISNIFATLEKLDGDDDTERTGENIKASGTEIPGHGELKQHKPCFDEECSKL